MSFLRFCQINVLHKRQAHIIYQSITLSSVIFDIFNLYFAGKVDFVSIGLPTKNNTSETTVQNLYRIYLIPYINDSPQL